MARALKIGLALLVAVLLHGALLFYGSRRVEGLAVVEATDASAAAPEADNAPAEKPDLQQPIDVGWNEPAEAAPSTDDVLAEPKPLPPRPAAVTSAASPKPEPRPAPVASKPAVVPAKPVAATASASASRPSTAAGKSGALPVIAADSSYANRVRQHLARYAGALPPGANGEARVQFVVQPDGRVSDVHLVRNSGHAGLDSLALNLPTMAQPLPLPGPLPQRLEVPVQAVAAQP